MPTRSHCKIPSRGVARRSGPLFFFADSSSSGLFLHWSPKKVLASISEKKKRNSITIILLDNIWGSAFFESDLGISISSSSPQNTPSPREISLFEMKSRRFLSTTQGRGQSRSAIHPSRAGPRGAATGAVRRGGAAGRARTPPTAPPDTSSHYVISLFYM